jgi:hypothetical protein
LITIVMYLDAMRGRRSLQSVGLWPITARKVEDVRVRCHRCAGVTIFPVSAGQSRREGHCLHCGATV